MRDAEVLQYLNSNDLHTFEMISRSRNFEADKVNCKFTNKQSNQILSRVLKRNKIRFFDKEQRIEMRNTQNVEDLIQKSPIAKLKFSIPESLYAFSSSYNNDADFKIRQSCFYLLISSRLPVKVYYHFLCRVP